MPGGVEVVVNGGVVVRHWRVRGMETVVMQKGEDRRGVVEGGNFCIKILSSHNISLVEASNRNKDR